MYVLVGWEEIDRWYVAIQPNHDLTITVLEWIDRFHDGYGFANGEPTGIEDLYVALVPSTSVVVTFKVLHRLVDPPVIAIRRIEPPAP